MRSFFVTLGFILFLALDSQSQVSVIQGIVTDSSGIELSDVTIRILNTDRGTISDDAGRYRLTVPADSLIDLEFRYVGYSVVVEKIRLADRQVMELNITLFKSTAVLSDVVIKDDELRNETSLTVIDPKTIQALPSAFGDFNRILVTLPGVVSNNELSSSYSVRGGSFDENLVYVNDIPIYRPFLISNGQQEGLSFINPDLVSAVRFSSGGWQPKYGDKLSSVLNVQYKQPESFGASASLSLLGGSAHVEGATGRVTYVAGARHKSSRYLLNTLETAAGYRPRFTDLQAYVTIRMDKKPRIKSPVLGILASYGRNRYQVRPETRTSEFGTFNQPLRFTVAFVGRELLEYDTYQAGLKYSSWIRDNWKSDVIVSGVKAFEREYTNIEGGYRLCDVDNQIGSPSFNECVTTRGIGTQFDYGRNTLTANLFSLETRQSILLDNRDELNFGAGGAYQYFDDYLNEYEFTDSSGYVVGVEQRFSDNILENGQLFGFVQYAWNPDPNFSMTGGIRLTYTTLNKQFLVSPRIQFSYAPDWERDVVFKLATGMYQQPPFYREFRALDGSINSQVEAQSSLHLIGGMDYSFQWWGRPFSFIAEAYYKHLWNVNPYDVDNVKTRYYATNDARAFATGVDLRVSGEFIPGTQSWFSLGILKTMEDVAGDGRGYIRRPTDQRINVAIQFEDHIPNDPRTRVNLNLFFGSGLPFGPPGNIEYRNVFDGESYRRIDIGFTRLIYLKKGREDEQLQISVEVLNLLGSDNPISYLFISDYDGNQFAVPNSLSARFLNLRLSLRLF
ncbi:TonB-dependent receptor [Fulvivirga sedimenti]|uniref:TonB-dependent receptor n=1 Tax=Fulvivirga sedimenti TaxID=2879465 RepID=A0A9X1HY70_9BACT|nr:carboxypeptidase-like regulatory domain-containing protein [Fulvivirga sedimenti]MCA6078897.1 TonB-dependent receptor [Fulvivirga sedimenti]